jgi:hypothetical protein
MFLLMIESHPAGSGFFMSCSLCFFLIPFLYH